MTRKNPNNGNKGNDGRGGKRIQQMKPNNSRYRNQDRNYNRNQQNTTPWNDSFPANNHQQRGGQRQRPVQRFRGTRHGGYSGTSDYNHYQDQSYNEANFSYQEPDPNLMNPPNFYSIAFDSQRNYPDSTQYPIEEQAVIPAADTSTTAAEIQINALTPAPPVQESKKKRFPSSSSSSSSSSDTESVDSVVKSLKKVVNKSLETQTESPKVKEPQQKTTAPKANDTPKKVKEENAKKAIVKKEKPSATSSSASSSSSSSSSSSDDSSSSDAETTPPKKSAESVEDVICLGQLERIEDLVEDETDTKCTKCVLCEKSGHISFHCQTICKNCNEPHHSLKDCPKPSNLSIVFSNFLQFCLKQSVRYNPNAELTLLENMSIMPATIPPSLSEADEESRVKRKSKSHHSETSNSGSRKRQQLTESTSSSESSSSDVSSRRKRRKRSKHSTVPQFGIPYPAGFNPSYAFGPAGAVNPLLAFGNMMGFNPGSMEYRKSRAKD